MATAGSAVTQRAGSLSLDQWKSFFDSDGRLVNEIDMRKAVFEGTITLRARLFCIFRSMWWDVCK